MSSPSPRNDTWYAKAAFGVLLCGLVGTLVALYSGISDPRMAPLLGVFS
jgi:hypothetical protein